MKRLIALLVFTLLQPASAQFSTFGMIQPMHFFILTSGAYAPLNPDSICASQVSGTSWRGKPTGFTIPSSKIKAFTCNNSSCLQLEKNATYTFARAGNASTGGATFKTDAAGLGPNDSNSWSGATYFGASVYWWSGRTSMSPTQASNSSTFENCTDWTDTGTTNTGGVGNTGATNGLRWDSTSQQCNTTAYFICVVDL